jgi:ABC-type multidrug transport system ATPase subunit
MHTNPTSPLLQLQNLQISYGGIQAVKGIDLDLWAGELVCLIGANGAGKTTTLNAIAGVLPLAGGDILYAGDLVQAFLDARQHGVDPLQIGLDARLVVARVGAHAQVLFHRQAGEDAAPLGHQGDAGAPVDQVADPAEVTI